MECIILAGGLGTRLRNTIGDYPKCMAEVNGEPFLQHILSFLEEQGCTRVILSLGYKHEIITDWISKHNYNFSIDHVVEEEPLGTGGGIQLALKAAKEANVAVLNGDTMFRVDLGRQFSYHKQQGAETTLALKPMQRFERYGVVNTDANGKVISFEEKRYREEGLINGGIYVIGSEAFLQRNLPAKFSFENDYLAKFVDEGRFYGFTSESYFIDIGIPEDYHKAQSDFKKEQQ